MDRPQATARPMCPWERSSEASLVATPLQAKPSPAPSMVTVAGEWRSNNPNRYGRKLDTPSTTSTTVIVKSEAWVLARLGAVRAAPNTPITIAHIVTCS